MPTKKDAQYWRDRRARLKGETATPSVPEPISEAAQKVLEAAKQMVEKKAKAKPAPKTVAASTTNYTCGCEPDLPCMGHLLAAGPAGFQEALRMGMKTESPEPMRKWLAGNPKTGRTIGDEVRRRQA